MSRALINFGETLGIIVDEDLVDNAVRQYLTHIRRCRRYQKKMRTSPEAREEWYRKRREYGRRYTSDPVVRAKAKEYRQRPEIRERRREQRRRQYHEKKAR